MKKSFINLTKIGAIALASMVAAPAVNTLAAEVEGWGDFKLYLDPGHAGHENGGLWGYSEAEKVLRVALNIKDMLQTYTDMPEENLLMCRYTDQDQKSLEERSDEANAWGADFYYSIHSDASASKNLIVLLFGGWMKNGVLVEKTPNGGKAYGEFLEPNLSGVMRIGSRGNRYDRDFYMPITEGSHENQYPYLSVNRRSNMPSLLSEGGYHTIAEQQQRNINDDYKRLEAFAAFQAILQYRGLPLPTQTFLTGMVTNSENNQPINGATITVGDRVYTTDTYESIFHKYTKNPNLIHNGFYMFEGLEAGSTVTVKFEAPGFEPQEKEVIISNGSAISSITNTGHYMTFCDAALVNASPAVIDAISLSDLEKVGTIYPLTITFSRNMDKASVEEALTINNNAEYTLEWVNDYTLNIDLSKFRPLFSYTLTIDGSKARNSQTNQLLDGDNDGVEGGDYVLNFTMAEPDLTAPVVVSTYPAAEGEALYTQRPPIRIEFDEIIDWNEDRNSGWFEIKDSTGKVYEIGHTSHSIIGEASVLHAYLNEDLANDVAVLVTLKPVADLSGNMTEDFAFRFLSEYRAMTKCEVIDPCESMGTFWAPNGSGSTKGVTEEGNSGQTVPFSPFHGVNGSFGITYSFDPDFSFEGSPVWIIRDHNPKGSNVTLRGKEGVITMWVYGDHSLNTTGLFIRDFPTNALVNRAEEMEVDFLGWNLMVWDLTNDELGHFTGTGDAMGSKWYLDAIFIKHFFGTDEDGEFIDPITDPEEEGYKAWSGDMAFHQIQRSVWDNDAERTANLDDIDMSGVDAVEVENNINVSVNGSYLNVFAGEQIQNVTIYAIDGTVLKSVAPMAENASVSLAELRSGVMIAKVSTAASTVTVKVIR